MSTRFGISSSILNWIPQYSGKSYEELYARFPKYEDWLVGNMAPTAKQIQDLAQFANIPLGYLYLQEPPNLPQKEIVDFRRISGSPTSAQYSPDLRDTIQTIQIRQNWLTEYRQNNGVDALSFIGQFDTTQSIPELLEFLYNLLDLKRGWQIGLHTNPFNLLRQRLEAVGIVVFCNGIVGNSTRRKLKVEEFRGFTLINRFAPVIFVNSSDTESGKLFTLAHEICHILLGTEGVSDTYSEPYCNAFAAEFLVPSVYFSRYWNESDGDYASMAKRFKVSELVIYRRALTHSYITQQTHDTLVARFMKAFNSLPAKESGGGDFYRNVHSRLGDSFSRTIIDAAKSGALSYGDAYELLGLKGKTFTNYVSKFKDYSF